MKRGWVGFVVAVLVCAGAQSAFAEATQGGDIRGVGSDPIKMLLVTSNTASAGNFGPNQLILGSKLYANDAGDSCGLYDLASLPTDATGLIDEWGEATDEETNVHLWPFPYKLVTDLTVITNGVCII